MTGKWEKMAFDWHMVDVAKLRAAAKRLAEQVGFSGAHGDAASKLLEIVDGGRSR